MVNQWPLDMMALLKSLEFVSYAVDGRQFVGSAAERQPQVGRLGGVDSAAVAESNRGAQFTKGA